MVTVPPVSVSRLLCDVVHKHTHHDLGTQQIRGDHPQFFQNRIIVFFRLPIFLGSMLILFFFRSLLSIYNFLIVPSYLCLEFPHSYFSSMGSVPLSTPPPRCASQEQQIFMLDLLKGWARASFKAGRTPLAPERGWCVLLFFNGISPQLFFPGPNPSLHCLQKPTRGMRSFRLFIHPAAVFIFGPSRSLYNPLRVTEPWTGAVPGMPSEGGGQGPPLRSNVPPTGFDLLTQALGPIVKGHCTHKSSHTNSMCGSFILY